MVCLLLCFEKLNAGKLTLEGAVDQHLSQMLLVALSLCS
jgi:hypothetical protein